MTQFLQLPRELRDMIYEEVVLWERARPTLGEKFMVYDRNSQFKKVYEQQSSLRGEFGCAYSLEETPPTCANCLCCNRQINEEMSEAIQRLRQKKLLAVKLDCVAEDESFHYFTWLGVPLVETTFRLSRRSNGYLPEWAENMLRKYVVFPLRSLSPVLSSVDYLGCCSATTRIRQLWIDIRIAGDRSAKWRTNSSPADRTGWAICAALKRLFEKGPYLSSEQKVPITVNTTVDELVLNVVPPRPASSNSSTHQFLDEDFPLDGIQAGTVHPKTVAKELVKVWSRIWAGDEFKGIFYGGLLEKIAKVRVCVEGETWRVRELKLELERGQRERRRIAERVGW